MMNSTRVPRRPMTVNDLNNALEYEKRRQTHLRGLERQIRQREHLLGSGMGDAPTSPGGAPLINQLKKVLPAKFLPGNIGAITDLKWPNFLLVPRFVLGNNPILTVAFEQTQAVEVGQEASFVIMAIARYSWSEDTAGEKAPLNITIRSRQSSRQFNDNPIPIQMIGDLAHPFVFSSPLPIQAQDFIEITMKTWITAPMQLAGEGNHEFVLFGERMKEGSEYEFLTKYLQSL